MNTVSLAEVLNRSDVWRGDRLVGAALTTVASGFAPLDSELPGGGWARGALTEVLADPALAPLMGAREAGALIAGTVVAREADGLSRVMTAAGPIWLALDRPPGTRLRRRILAHEVILSRAAPQGLSALNALPATVIDIRDGMVQLALGDERMLAQITPRSVQMLDLKAGAACHAIVKSVSVLPS
jgi:molybdate transport system ATP-binding protein